MRKVFLLGIIGLSMMRCQSPGKELEETKEVLKEETKAVLKETKKEIVAIRNEYRALRPKTIRALPDTLMQTSGLVCWKGKFWSHNDTRFNNLYELDSTGKLEKIVPLPIKKIGNWEDMTQDEGYFYIGDFGNNSYGNRKNLVIFRVAKKDLLQSKVKKVDSIRFSYSDQTDFSNTGPNNTDFDCEAMMAYGDSLYLFTKQWLKQGTSVYALPKKPGKYVAKLKAEYQTDGLITGAAAMRGKNIVALCGYNTNNATFLNPFVLLLTNFEGDNFFKGKKQRLDLSLPYHQVEAIAFDDEGRCFITNEGFQKLILDIRPKLLEVRLQRFLKD